MYSRVAGLLLSLSPMVAGACTSSVSDGAIWRSVWLAEATRIGSSQCSWVRTTSDQSIEGVTEHDYVAIHDYSADGVYSEAYYIAPAGVPDDFDLTVDTGELVLELKLNRASFDDAELLETDIATNDGGIVKVVHWFTEDCRDDPEPPEGFDPPGGSP